MTELADLPNLRARVVRLERQVDFLLKHFGLEDQERAAPIILSDVEQLVVKGALLEAIKRYREKTGTGLAEAKQAVDQMRERLGKAKR